MEPTPPHRPDHLQPRTPADTHAAHDAGRAAPFIRAPEKARTVFVVTVAAASLPVLAGLVMFGWRAAWVAVLCVISCVLIERTLFKVTHLPALYGRTHAVLTGVLLAITLPAWTPWYVPIIASAFAIIVGKGIFGGVGHFLWQPALVGRLAVAVMFPATLTQPFAKLPQMGPVLAQNRVLIGDILSAGRPERYRRWRGTAAPMGTDALIVAKPSATLAGLTSTPAPAYSALAYIPPKLPGAKPTLFSRLPAMQDLIYGARPGGIGETSVLIVFVAGMYLVYRNYVNLALPMSILISAAAVAAVAPVKFAGPNDTTVWVWWPLLKEGADVGAVYVCYQLLSFELLAAAFFFATETTSRPVTTGGQVLFGLGCGATAMLLKLYLNIPIPAYTAVLAMNTFTPTIDSIWRPRVLGQAGWWQRRKKPR